MVLHAGRTLIRSMGFEPYYHARFAHAIDTFNKFNYMSTSVLQWVYFHFHTT